MSKPEPDEEVIAVMIKKVEEDRPTGLIARAVNEGIISGFRNVMNARRIKREMRDDAKRLLLHSKELVQWDVGDDHATSADIREIADRLSKYYGLKIKGAE